MEEKTKSSTRGLVATYAIAFALFTALAIYLYTKDQQGLLRSTALSESKVVSRMQSGTRVLFRGQPFTVSQYDYTTRKAVLKDMKGGMGRLLRIFAS